MAQIIFAPFRLDPVNECLWRDEQAIDLKPKAFSLLRYFAERPGQLLTKEELLDAIWSETFVTDAVLKVCVGELRKALGDDAKQPQFIATAHRRGYRFIGKITTVRDSLTQQSFGADHDISKSTTVGRNAELARLQGLLKRVLAGERQTVFVTGEPGIGKTTLVETFLRDIADSNLLITRGQCLEQTGAGEAYLPIMEALSALPRDPKNTHILEILRRCAPMWLLQMPWLVDQVEREALRRDTVGATRERMLREMSQALEEIVSVVPLVLVLEDLHWSDNSTLDLLSYLSRKPGLARLLVIGTYRPSDILSVRHPLKAVEHELKMHRQCEEVRLGFLSQRSVVDYLVARFPGNSFPDDLSGWIHARTEGSPLFMVNLIDYLVDCGSIVHVDGEWMSKVKPDEIELGLPEDTRQIIENQIERLSDEDQRLLEAASVVGAEFSARAVAAALKVDEIELEEQCDRLARQHHFLRRTRTGELPEQTSYYGFIHSLYRNVFYRRLALARRAQLHLRIGHYQSAQPRESPGASAVDLAMHFEQGRDFSRAAKYLCQAGEHAMSRFANQEALALARQGLELLRNLPDTTERTNQELGLQMILCGAMPGIEGFGSGELEGIYQRTRELCEQLGQDLQLFRVLQGLRAFYLFRADMEKARETAEQLLELAESRQNHDLLAQAHWAMSQILVHQGEFFRAEEHSKLGLAHYDPQQRDSHLRYHRQDPGAVLSGCKAWIQWFLGYPDLSLSKSREALALAKETAYPENLCITIFYAATVRQLRGETRDLLELADTLIAIAGEHGLTQWNPIGNSWRGWALTELGHKVEGIGLLRETVSALGKTGSEIGRLHFTGLLAEALMKDEQTTEGLAMLNEALDAAGRRGVRFYEAELFRIKGELLLKSEAPAEAEDCFREAIKVSRRQHARSLELRAAMSLGRLWKEQGKRREAQILLKTTYDWFTEGFATEDLKEAAALVKELT